MEFCLSRPRPRFPARSRIRPAQPASRAPARRSRPGPRPRPPSSSRARPRNAGRRGRTRSPRVGHALPPLAARRPRPALPPARAHSKRPPEPPHSLTSPPSPASHPSSLHRADARLAAASSGFRLPVPTSSGHHHQINLAPSSAPLFSPPNELLRPLAACGRAPFFLASPRHRHGADEPHLSTVSTVTSVLSRPVVSCWPLPGDSVARLGGSSAGRNRPIGRDRRRDVVVGNTGDSLGSLLPLPRSVG
jgi:hypothetical protein